MNRRPALRLTCIALSLAVGTVGAVVTQDNTPRRITRVERPVFTEKDSDGIYFDNLFADGLAGDRPVPLTGQTARNNAGGTNSTTSQLPSDTLPSTGSNSPEAGQGGLIWSTVLPSEVIEDEVKALQQALTRDVTTPGKFSSDYRKARQSFSILSMLFAVIRDYDTDEVRWKDSAAHAQTSFERAAANARVGSAQSYQSAKNKLADLSGLIRGESIPEDEAPPDEIDWGRVVDRSPLMRRLEIAKDTVKPLLSSRPEFTNNLVIILHESSLIAAMGHVIGDENSDDGDDESYAEMAKEMASAAVALSEASRSGDYDEASVAFGLIGKSCQDCHADWR